MLWEKKRRKDMRLNTKINKQKKKDNSTKVNNNIKKKLNKTDSFHMILYYTWKHEENVNTDLKKKAVHALTEKLLSLSLLHN